MFISWKKQLFLKKVLKRGLGVFQCREDFRKRLYGQGLAVLTIQGDSPPYFVLDYKGMGLPVKELDGVVECFPPRCSEYLSFQGIVDVLNFGQIIFSLHGFK